MNSRARWPLRAGAWLLLIGLSLTAAADPPRAELRLVNSGPIYLGQQVTVDIELQVDGWFAGATVPPLFSLDSALVVRQPPFAANGSRRIDGRSWATQTWQRTFFPQRAGLWRFPEQLFGLVVGSDRSDGVTTMPLTVATPALDFVVLSPPARTLPAGSGRFAPAAEQLALASHWSQVGAVSRQRIELSGAGISNGLFPDLAGQAAAALPAGVELYASELERADSWRRGQLVGRVVWQLDYLPEQPGSYRLPALRVDYWQPRSQQWQQLSAAGYQLELAAAPDAALPAILAAQWQRWLWLLALAVLVGAALLYWRQPLAVAVRATYRRRPRLGRVSLPPLNPR